MKLQLSPVICALLFILQTGCHQPSAAGPAAVVQKYLELLQDGSVERATELCPDRVRRDPELYRKMRDQLAPITGQLIDIGKFTVEILDEQITGNTAVVTFTIWQNNRRFDRPFKYRLIKEGGLWKING